MANDYQYISSTGTVVPDTDAILTDVQNEFKAVFGADLDVSPSTPQGVMITAEALAREGVVRNNAALANQINPNLAGGVFLDAICALTGLQRTAATRSVVVATLTGVAGTIVPAGVQARTTAGDVFESLAQVVLDGSGTATVEFRALEYGPLPVAIGALNQIVSGVLGWETITNAAAATLGEVEQSDAALRKLRNRTLFLQGVALAGAISSEVSAVPNVRSLAFLENPYSEPMGWLTSVTHGATLAGTMWGLSTAGGTGTDGRIIINTDSIAFHQSTQGLPTVNPWPVAKYATKGNITLSGLGTQANGDWASSLTAGDIVLVKGQTTAAQNGVYTAAAGAWARAYVANGAQIMGSVGGVSLVEHSLYVCADGGDDTEVATAILASKSLGCDFNGNTTVSVTEPTSGQPYSVKFQRPEEVPILVKVTVSVNGSLVNPTTAVPEAVLAYVNGELPNEEGFTVGAAVSPFEIGAAINQNYATLYIKKVEVAINSGTPVYSTADIAINKDQVPRTEIGDISVVVV